MTTTTRSRWLGPKYARVFVIAGLVAGAVAVAVGVFPQLGRSDRNAGRLSGRPLVASLSDCRQATKVESLSKDLGPMTGGGRVRVVGDLWNFQLGGPADFRSDRWGGNKLLIAAHISVGDHVLVRGKAAPPGIARVGFGNDPEPVFSLDLQVDDRPVLDGGWIDFPTTIRLEKDGCYILQFDYVGGTTRVALRYGVACDARPIAVELARSVGRNVDVSLYFSVGDFAWLSDQGTFPNRIGADAANYSTLSPYFSRLAASGDRWSIQRFVGHPVQSGVANFEGELARGRRYTKTTFKGAVRCATGKIVALSIAAPTQP